MAADGRTPAADRQYTAQDSRTEPWRIMRVVASGDRQTAGTDPDLLGYFVLLVAAAFMVDWLTKSWALINVGDSTLALGSLTLGVARNDGFAFSAGAGAISPWVVFAARLAVMVGLVTYALRLPALGRIPSTGLALLLAGGLGNAADTAVRGAVVDFIGAGPLLFPMGGELYHLHFVFNVADVLILAGLLLAAPLIRMMARDARHRLAGTSLIEDRAPTR
jgi:lipoprotein signal peptidase